MRSTDEPQQRRGRLDGLIVVRWVVRALRDSPIGEIQVLFPRPALLGHLPRPTIVRPPSVIVHVKRWDRSFACRHQLHVWSPNAKSYFLEAPR